MIIKTSVRFFLKRQKKARSRVVMRVSYMAHSLEFQTGVKVEDRNFDLSAQKVVGKRGSCVPVELYNRQLMKMRTAIGQVFYSYEMMNIDPEPKDIRNDFCYLMRPIKRNKIKGSLPIFQSNVQLNGNNHSETYRIPKNKAKNSMAGFFWNCYDEFMEEQGKLRFWTDSTKEKFRALRNHLQDFDKTLTYDYFNANGIANFIKYLQDKRKMKNSTIDKQLDFLRSFLKWSCMKGYCMNKEFESYRPKLKHVNKPVVFLDGTELKKLEDYKIPKGKDTLKDTRDVFLFCCYTGLRYSDVAKLTWDDIHKNGIEIVTKKTSDRLIIDFNRKSKSLLDKYSNFHYKDKKVFPVISNQKMNKHLQELCMLAGIDAPVKYTFFHGNNRMEQVYPKYQVIGTQSGRRTFICTALACGIPPNVVMKWTGHSCYKAMKPYIDVAGSTTARYMKRFDQ